MSRLTRWMNGAPPAVGEYNVSNSRDPLLRRWWNGKDWSCAYSVNDRPKKKKLRRATIGKPYGVSWRGLLERGMPTPLAT